MISDFDFSFFKIIKIVINFKFRKYIQKREYSIKPKFIIQHCLSSINIIHVFIMISKSSLITLDDEKLSLLEGISIYNIL